MTLQITPEVPHLFQGFAAILGDGDAALATAPEFLDARTCLVGR